MAHINKYFYLCPYLIFLMSTFFLFIKHMNRIISTQNLLDLMSEGADSANNKKGLS